MFVNSGSVIVHPYYLLLSAHIYEIGRIFTYFWISLVIMWQEKNHNMIFENALGIMMVIITSKRLPMFSTFVCPVTDEAC